MTGWNTVAVNRNTVPRLKTARSLTFKSRAIVYVASELAANMMDSGTGRDRYTGRATAIEVVSMANRRWMIMVKAYVVLAWLYDTGWQSVSAHRLLDRLSIITSTSRKESRLWLQGFPILKVLWFRIAKIFQVCVLQRSTWRLETKHLLCPL